MREKNNLFVAGTAKSSFVGGAKENRGGVLAHVAKRSHSTYLSLSLSLNLYSLLISVQSHCCRRCIGQESVHFQNSNNKSD